MMKQLRGTVSALVVMGGVVASTTGAYAQIAVIDDPNLEKRNEDEKQNADSKENKAAEKGWKKAVVCTYSNKYRNEMFRRSPADALKRDAANVSLIRHYAKKYGVPEGLALAVSYQEARFDTCAGSHTGVKGAMQLTQKTGRGLGFDRDINEQNIEGGVKLLGMGVNRCGATNYSCLARWYNGSTAAEQRGWAAGVGRWHNYFNNYVGSPGAVGAAPPTFSITTAQGSAGTAQTGAVGAVNAAAGGLENSYAGTQANANLIDALAAGVGGTSEYKDAWEENSDARALNAKVVNEYIRQALLLNELLNSRMQLDNAERSQGSKLVTVEGRDTGNPFSCDPSVYLRARTAVERWPKCAREAWEANGGDGTTTIVQPNAAAAAANVNDLQLQ